MGAGRHSAGNAASTSGSRVAMYRFTSSSTCAGESASVTRASHLVVSMAGIVPGHAVPGYGSGRRSAASCNQSCPLGAPAQQALLLALPLAVLLGIALVVLLLALGEANGELHAALAVVQVQRHQGVAALLDLADELGDLVGIEQELAGAGGIGVHVGGRGGQGAHVHADDEGLLALQHHIGLLDLHPPGADRLDLPPLEHEARLVALLDEVVVERLLVVD